ncbi:holo-ACP synthase [Selenihalanaerobacter shriftii]|uniref:Holo-[acyl-carrier-protein] synthase n=1 Tax=Selenihalanaerobacter shriftii TaxID=142842 RepID=A0A1T4JWS6_9FIRM|nr:holo-ACP synthase [Selenihalanaerobacter shriftii]SJZ34485.1 holo-[acyl-carrier-protein] synthase [Selenihalanaerobacter shriftii]
MIYGIGVDIVEVKRIEQSLKKHDERFKEKIFTDGEVDYCLKSNNAAIHFAARFAAKEAIVKALGTGLRNMKWTDIEIIKDELGKPEVKLHDKAKKIAQSLGIKKLLISLSHTDEYAVAQAMASKTV